MQFDRGPLDPRDRPTGFGLWIAGGLLLLNPPQMGVSKILNHHINFERQDTVLKDHLEILQTYPSPRFTPSSSRQMRSA